MKIFHPLLLGTMLAVAGTGLAAAQTANTSDGNQLPTIQGKVAQYSLTQRGDVDGLILTDGMQVHLPPYLGTQLVYTVKPGDTVTVRGLQAYSIPVVQATSVTDAASGATITNYGPPGPAGAQQMMTAQGKVKERLYGPRGELNGVLLEDGTQVHLPPPQAQRLAAELAPGNTVFVQGTGIAGPIGRVIAAQSIGPNQQQMAQIQTPPPPHGPGRHHPPGPGPAGGPGAPPPPPSGTGGPAGAPAPASSG